LKTDLWYVLDQNLFVRNDKHFVSFHIKFISVIVKTLKTYRALRS